jgi:FAD/FMN-containing dehydrogenase
MAAYANARTGGTNSTWLRPGDAEYEDARQVYNDAHQSRPAIIARVFDENDVRAALSHASAAGLQVAVRGGGHSIGGFGTVEGGMVIDLRRMSAIVPAEQPGEFWIGGGALAGDVARKLDKHGLVIPLGDSPEVGIGGITLGGGLGWLTRKFGLTLDCLTGAEIVTADGRSRSVDVAHEPDLFWALRGGGGSFGVVTRLRFRPHPLGQVLGGTMTLPLTVETLRDLVEFAADAPNELGIIAIAMRSWDEAAIPVLMLTLVWSGDIGEGERVLAKLRSVATPIAEDIHSRSYARLAEGAPSSVTNATETILADELDGAAVAAIVGAIEERAVEGVFSVIEIRVLGGAIADVPVADTAFAHRERRFLISPVRVGFPLAQYAEHRAWVESVGKSLRHIAKGAYGNFVEHAGPESAEAVYPGDTGRRLAALKQRFDPRNVFGRSPLVQAPGR